MHLCTAPWNFITVVCQRVRWHSAYLSVPRVRASVRWYAVLCVRVCCRFLTPIIGVQIGLDVVALIWLTRTAYLTITTFKKKKVVVQAFGMMCFGA